MTRTTANGYGGDPLLLVLPKDASNRVPAFVDINARADLHSFYLQQSLHHQLLRDPSATSFYVAVHNNNRRFLSGLLNQTDKWANVTLRVGAGAGACAHARTLMGSAGLAWSRWRQASLCLCLPWQVTTAPFARPQLTEKRAQAGTRPLTTHTHAKCRQSAAGPFAPCVMHRPCLRVCVPCSSPLQSYLPPLCRSAGCPAAALRRPYAPTTAHRAANALTQGRWLQGRRSPPPSCRNLQISPVSAMQVRLG